jgi:hypothetical protein
MVANVHNSDITIGFGRAIDPEWADEFEGRLRGALASHVDFRMRERPGIVHVSGNDLYAQGIYFEGANRDERYERAETYFASVVKTLSGETELDEAAALASIGLPLYEEETAMQRRWKGTRVSIKVQDVLSTTLPSRHVIDLEREVSEAKFEVPAPTVRNPDVTPVHRIHLGHIASGIDVSELPDILDGVVAELEGEVPLFGLGMVDVQLREPATS